MASITTHEELRQKVLDDWSRNGPRPISNIADDFDTYPYKVKKILEDEGITVPKFRRGGSYVVEETPTRVTTPVPETHAHSLGLVNPSTDEAFLRALVEAGRQAALELERRAEQVMGVPPTNTNGPSTWGSTPAEVKSFRFFTSHAAERLRTRHGVRDDLVVKSMSWMSHQVKGTHFRGYEGLDLGKAKYSLGEGNIWAVELNGRVTYIVVDAGGVIVTVLPDEPKQLHSITNSKKASLEAFKTEVHCRYNSSVSLVRYSKGWR